MRFSQLLAAWLGLVSASELPLLVYAGRPAAVAAPVGGELGHDLTESSC